MGGCSFKGNERKGSRGRVRLANIPCQWGSRKVSGGAACSYVRSALSVGKVRAAEDCGKGAGRRHTKGRSENALRRLAKMNVKMACWARFRGAGEEEGEREGGRDVFGEYSRRSSTCQVTARC